MVLLGIIGGQFGRREDRPEKEPVAEFARDDHRVLALPADARCLRERLFHHRRSIDEHLDVGTGARREEARQLPSACP